MSNHAKAPTKRWSWVPVRRHPYNRQLIIFGRWRQDYAPAYGWRSWLRRSWSGEPRTRRGSTP